MLMAVELLSRFRPQKHHGLCVCSMVKVSGVILTSSAPSGMQSMRVQQTFDEDHSVVLNDIWRLHTKPICAGKGRALSGVGGGDGGS